MALKLYKECVSTFASFDGGGAVYHHIMFSTITKRFKYTEWANFGTAFGEAPNADLFMKAVAALNKLPRKTRITLFRMNARVEFYPGYDKFDAIDQPRP